MTRFDTARRLSPATPMRRRHLLLGGLGTLALAACGGGGDDPSATQPSVADGARETASASVKNWRVPAETEPQQAVMLASPTLEYKAGWSNLATQAQMVRALIGHVRVVYLCNDIAADRQALTQALQALGVPAATVRASVDFVRVAHADYWVRDYGGLFMTNGQGAQRVVDFDFDGYGYNAFAGPLTVAVYDHDNDLSVRVAAELKRPVVRSPLIAEGGNLHFNGRGTVIATELGLLGRNPGWSKAQVEDELARVFNVRKVLWLPRGLATDAHTVLQTPYTIGGERVYNLGVNHIDEMVSWTDPRTLLLPEVTDDEVAAGDAAGDPIARMNREILDEAFAILSAATNADGQPLQLVRVPEPGTIVIDLLPGDGMYEVIADLDAHPVHRLVGAQSFVDREPVKFALAASYMNFLVANGVVLVPAFHKPGRDPSLADKDEQFRATVQQRYPGRQVVQIDVDSLVVGGGGMHCISQHIPA